LVRGAQNDVVYLTWLKLYVSIDERIYKKRRHIIGSRPVETASEGLGQPRSDTIYDYYISHDFLSL
jgi:hypothetical protein